MGISILSLCPLQFLESHRNPGAVLLLPFVVSCINLAVPRFYSAFRLVERYETPRQEVYMLLIRWVCMSLPTPPSVVTEGGGVGVRGGLRSSVQAPISRKNFKGIVCLYSAG